MRENWNLTFNSTDPDDDHNDVKNINLSWQNRPLAEVKANLNTFLAAVGVPLEVVEKAG